jgi:hypothetical protein
MNGGGSNEHRRFLNPSDLLSYEVAGQQLSNFGIMGNQQMNRQAAPPNSLYNPTPAQQIMNNQQGINSKPAQMRNITAPSHDNVIEIDSPAGSPRNQ